MALQILQHSERDLFFRVATHGAGPQAQLAAACIRKRPVTVESRTGRKSGALGACAKRQWRPGRAASSRFYMTQQAPDASLFEFAQDLVARLARPL